MGLNAMSIKQKLIVKKVGLLLTLLLFNCSRPYIKPVAYEPEKHCDKKYMTIDASIPDTKTIPVREVRKLEKANKDCGHYIHTVAAHNTNAAESNRPDSFWEKLQTGSLGVVLGALLMAIALL